jgi:hypothetical protein
MLIGKIVGKQLNYSAKQQHYHVFTAKEKKFNLYVRYSFFGDMLEMIVD